MHATHDVLIYIYTISIIGFTFIIRSSGICNISVFQPAIPATAEVLFQVVIRPIRTFWHSGHSRAFQAFLDSRIGITKRHDIDIFMYTSI